MKVGGIPVPTIKWQREGQTLRSGGRITIDIEEESTSLTVKKVTRQEDGLYHLNAANEVGEATAKFDVEILGKLKLYNLLILSI